jgi:hypothetical protein
MVAVISLALQRPPHTLMRERPLLYSLRRSNISKNSRGLRVYEQAKVQNRARARLREEQNIGGQIFGHRHTA